jgi:hypothetical protein
MHRHHATIDLADTTARAAQPHDCSHPRRAMKG